MYLRKGPNRKPCLSLCLLFSSIIAFVSNGCTMCPSPYDYSGTVPGSVNQNDFRIRANGILPIWRRPKPWPPVVSQESKKPHLATSDPLDDTPAVSRVIVASHDEEVPTVRRNSSVLIEHSLQAISVDEDEQTEKNNSSSSETTIESTDSLSPEGS